jgi:hypothetical protein
MKVVRSSPLRTGRLNPQEFSWYSFLEAESTPGHMFSVGTFGKKSSSTPPGIDLETFRLIAQCLNHYATQGPRIFQMLCSLSCNNLKVLVSTNLTRNRFNRKNPYMFHAQGLRAQVNWRPGYVHPFFIR